MNWMPLVGFYYRRHNQLSALLGKGSAGGAQKFLDFVKTNAPLIKKYWPQLNEDDLIDDAIETLEAVILDKPDPNYPDNTQR